jgi:hypothetical protein
VDYEFRPGRVRIEGDRIAEVAFCTEGEPIEIAARDEEETIVLTRKNGEETLALIFNCSSSARMFNEYAQKYDLLRENPFDGKIEGLDAAVIVL